MNFKILSILLLIPLTFNVWVTSIQFPGIDFYHYWGVAKAQQLSRGRLPSPYLDPSRYSNVLNQYVTTVTDKRLQGANAYRQKLDLTGTPLLYSAFSVLPQNYSNALKTFQAVQIIAFVVAISLVGLLSKIRVFLLPIALILSASFHPFMLDVRVANLSSIQLLTITLLTLFVEKSSNNTSKSHLINSIALVFCLILVNLLKPNLLLISLSLGISFLCRYGIPKLKLILAFTITLLTLILVTSPQAFFNAGNVWQDWYKLISVSQDRLAYPTLAGNLSMPLILVQQYEIEMGLAVCIITIGLITSLVAALILATSLTSISKDRVIEVINKTVKLTPLCVGLAISTTMALSPLVWAHYYTLILFPALWLCLEYHQWKAAPWLGSLAIILTSASIPNMLIAFTKISPAIEIGCYVAGWLCLWIGLLGSIANISISKSKIDTKTESV